MAEPNPDFHLTPCEARRVEEATRQMIAAGHITSAPDPEPEPIRPSLRPPNDPAEYIDPNRFPVTTREGMTLAEQMEEDAYWLAEIREYLADDGNLSKRKRAELLELLYKVPEQPRIRELAATPPTA